MIVLRNKNFSSEEKDDRKPRKRDYYMNTEGNPKKAIAGTVLGTGISAYVGGQVAGGIELGKMLKETDEILRDRAMKGDRKALNAINSINSNPVEFMQEFLNRAKKAKPAKGKLLNRFNRAVAKGAVKTAAIPLAIGSLSIYGEKKLKDRYDKGKARYEKDLREWEKRNNINS